MPKAKVVVEIDPESELELDSASYLVNSILDCLADSLPEEVRLGIAHLKVYTNDTEFLASASGEGLKEREYSEELEDEDL